MFSLHGFEERMADAVLRDLVAAGQLPGAVRGRDYIPFVFSVSQRQSVATFLSQNNYLTIDRAKALQVCRVASCRVVSCRVVSVFRVVSAPLPGR